MKARKKQPSPPPRATKTKKYTLAWLQALWALPPHSSHGQENSTDEKPFFEIFAMDDQQTTHINIHATTLGSPDLSLRAFSFGLV